MRDGLILFSGADDAVYDVENREGDNNIACHIKEEVEGGTGTDEQQQCTDDHARKLQTQGEFHVV